MSISDLLFIILVLGTALLLLVTVGAFFLRRWVFIRRWLGGLLLLWLIYLAVGTIVAIATPQRLLPMGSDRCFDEMCFAVTGFRRAARIEAGAQTTEAHGVFYIVDVRVSSRSLGRAQHEAGRTAMLIDQAGRTYNVSAEGMRALEHSEGLSPGLDTDLNPGQSVVAKLVFDLPSNVSSPGFTLGSSLVFYPPRIVLADDMHFLHKPTITRLQ